MIFILIPAILTLFIGIRYRKKGDVNSYMAKEGTTSICGLFALLVFFSHFNGYPELSSFNQFDLLARDTSSALGQLVVVPFLFFSGYGIFEQIKSRGDGYIKALPKKRIFKIYLMFLFAWFFYFILALIFNSNYSVRHYISSIFGITSIGNSNWYVVIIIALYFSTYLSFKVSNDKKVALIINLLLGTLLYFILKNQKDLDSSWWNTIFAYLAGLVYSFFKEKILAIYQKYNWTRIVSLIIVVGLTAAFGLLNFIYPNDLLYALMVISFALILPSLLANFKIGNKFLLTLGKYTFWIYILQRIPMIIFSYVPYIRNTVYLYFVICLMITAILAILIDKLFNKIWTKITK